MIRASVLSFVAEKVLAVRANGVTRVAVDGVDGAGKTVFAGELADALASGGRQIIRASADDFLAPQAVRWRRGRESPDGFFEDSYDYGALRRLLLDPLAPGGSRRFRRVAFDLAADAPVDAAEETAEPDAVLLLDGLFLHRPELRDVWNLSVFLRVTPETSVARCAARDGSVPAHVDRYLLGQRRYLTECDPERAASLVIDNEDLTAPRVVS